MRQIVLMVALSAAMGWVQAATVTQPDAGEMIPLKKVSGRPEPIKVASIKPEAVKTALDKSESTETVSAKSGGNEVQPNLQPQDPYEKFNRAVFSFNDTVDRCCLKPIAKGYNAILPTPINKGIHNFFNNIGELPTIANDLLQFKFTQMANDAWRFGINTTIGILGFFDVATRMQLTHHTNDFGLTLAFWGYEQTNYLVLPFYGPYTVRDMFNLPVDYFAFSVYPYIHPWQTRYSLYAVGVVDRRANLLQYESLMDEAAVDRYAFVRNAYLQHRAYEIEHGDQVDYNKEKPVAFAAG